MLLSVEVDVMSKPVAAGGETALQLIKESLDEELSLVTHVFVVLGASVCQRIYYRNNHLITKR